MVCFEGGWVRGWLVLGGTGLGDGVVGLGYRVQVEGVIVGHG